MTRGELLGTVALAGVVRATPAGEDWTLDGETAPVDHARHAAVVLIEAAITPQDTAWFLLSPDAPGVRVDPPVPTLGLRGLDACRVHLEGCRVTSRDRLGLAVGRGDSQGAAILALARLGVAAIGVGLAQATFEAALRYSQQRTTFGKPIAHHQAIQLALAGMATRVTAARLLTYAAAAPDADDTSRRIARVYASDIAYEVTLDSMRVHGGYGYTTEFPVERYYRDAAHLASVPTTNAADRAEIARHLAPPAPARGAASPR